MNKKQVVKIISELEISISDSDQAILKSFFEKTITKKQWREDFESIMEAVDAMISMYKSTEEANDEDLEEVMGAREELEFTINELNKYLT